MENKATFVVQTDKSFKNKIKKYCEINGLVLGKFVERAIMHELERTGYKEQAAPETPQAEPGKQAGAQN